MVKRCDPSLTLRDIKERNPSIQGDHHRSDQIRTVIKLRAVTSLFLVGDVLNMYA